MIEFVVNVPGNPVPKERPRVVTTNAYTPHRTQEAERDLAVAVKKAAKKAGLQTPDRVGRYTVAAVFYRKNAVRCDLDNLMKLVLDACNKVIWHDDHQVVELHAKVHRKVPPGRTVLKIRREP